MLYTYFGSYNLYNFDSKISYIRIICAATIIKMCDCFLSSIKSKYLHIYMLGALRDIQDKISRCYK